MLASGSRLRDDSRSRRATIVEERLRHRSQPRHASAPTAAPRPRLFYFTWRVLFYKAFDAISFFVASYLTQSQPQNPLLALLSFSTASITIFSFLISRPSVRTLKVLLNRRRSLIFIVLAAILSARTLLLLIAVHSVGPTRALITTGTVFPLMGTLLINSARIRTSNASPAPLLAGAALVLIGYDASESSMAHDTARMLSKKMGQRISRWKTKISKLSSKNSSELASDKTPSKLIANEIEDPDNNQADPPIDDDSMKTIPDGSRFATEALQRRTELEAKLRKKRRKRRKQEPLVMDEAPPQIDGVDANDDQVENNEHFSRKPLAVVNDSEGVPDNSNDAKLIDQSPLNHSSTLETVSDVRPADEMPLALIEGSLKNLSERVEPWNDAMSMTYAGEDGRTMFVWIAFVLLSCWLFEVSNGMVCSLVSEVGDWSLVAFCVSITSLALQAPFVMLSAIGVLPMAWTDTSSTAPPLPSVLVQASAFGWCSFLLPLFAIVRNDPGMSSAAFASTARPAASNKISLSGYSIARLQFCTSNCFGMYICVLATLPTLHTIGSRLLGVDDEVSLYSFLAAFFILCAAWFEASRARHIVDEARSSGLRLDSANRTSIKKWAVSFHGSFSQSHKAIRSYIVNAIFFLRTFLAEAHTNKASWQVLNFFLLQAGMVFVESIYALATKSTGLILVSADNIFCCVALALGLYAIKLTASRPAAVYTYGMTRFESLCGFANGMLLVYIAVLVVLEGIERHLNPGEMEYAHTFTVCVIGIIGNLVGLVFFPPESRRENHNVQGIYWHIWGNTLAFVGVASSTVLTEVAPHQLWVGVCGSIIVAVIIIASAVPLIARSGRVLLMSPSAEKRIELAALRTRIKQVHGVLNVSALRAWNLTPTCMVASVRISTAPLSSQQHDDVLFKVRSLFASVGISSSQATIQISSDDSSNLYTRGVHKRVLSGTLVETPELEGLYIQREQQDVI